jgi:hypothetical protein
MFYAVFHQGLARRVFQQVDVTETKLREEVEFWRKLIGKLELQGRGPVHPRMRDALAYAAQKLRARGQTRSQDNRVPPETFHRSNKLCIECSAQERDR